MALSPGTRIGSYEVTALLGVGGMGEVYRAMDTKLKRQVAIKVLPAFPGRAASGRSRTMAAHIQHGRWPGTRSSICRATG